MSIEKALETRFRVKLCRVGICDVELPKPDSKLSSDVKSRFRGLVNKTPRSGNVNKDLCFPQPGYCFQFLFRLNKSASCSMRDRWIGKRQFKGLKFHYSAVCDVMWQLQIQSLRMAYITEGAFSQGVETSIKGVSIHYVTQISRSLLFPYAAGSVVRSSVSKSGTHRHTHTHTQKRVAASKSGRNSTI